MFILELLFVWRVCTVIMLMEQAGGFEWIYVTSQWVNDQKQWQVCFLDVAA